MLALGPIVGALVGSITNVITNHWNWWLVGILTILVGVAAAIAIRLEGQSGTDSAEKRRYPWRSRRQRHRADRINTLPRDIDDFTGREALVSDLRMALFNGPHRDPRNGAGVYSIEGIGGIGKTTLAVHLAYQLAPRYPDAVLFLDLHAHDMKLEPLTPYEALGVLLSDLGFPGEKIPDRLEARVSMWRRELAAGQMLILLDNVSGPEQVRELLGGGQDSRCLFLITSRQRLFELEAASNIVLDTLSPNEAATLFQRVLGRTTDPQAEVLDVVRRLDCLPLAVRLSAALLRSRAAWTVRDLLDREVTGNKTIKNIYLGCFEDLSPTLKKFFLLLALHPGSLITAEAAAALMDSSVATAASMLDELYNRYLIEEPSLRRFKLHDVIKEFARREADSMNGASEQSEAMNRLLAYYTVKTSSASAIMGEFDLVPVSPPAMETEIAQISTDSAALTWLDEELGNLLACSYFAIDRPIFPYAWQLPASMTYYLRLRGFFSQAVDLLEKAQRAMNRHPDRTGEIFIYRRRGQLDRLQGNYATSRQELNAALQLAELQLAEEIGDEWQLARCWFELGHLDRATGEFAAARDNFTRALEIIREQDNPRAQAGAEMNLAVVLHALGGPGDTAQAIAYLEHSLQIADGANDRRAQAASLYQLGAIRRDTGDLQEARQLLNRALAIYTQSGNLHGQADCHLHIARVEKIEGDVEAAKADLAQALRLYVEMGFKRGQADTYFEFSLVSSAAGDEPMALVHRERAASLDAELGITRPE